MEPILERQLGQGIETADASDAPFLALLQEESKKMVPQRREIGLSGASSKSYSSAGSRPTALQRSYSMKFFASLLSVR
jgi:hypothetical protein